MTAVRRDAWTTFVFCLLLGGFIFADTLRYPEVQGQGFGQGPAFYPQLLAGALIFLGALILLQGLSSKRDASTGEEIDAKNRGIRYAPVILLMALCLVLIALMKYLGFFVSGFLLTFLTVRLIRRSLKMRHLIADLGFSVGMIIVVYLVFEVFVGIELPGSIFLD